MTCEHDWVSSGECFATPDRIHTVLCTKCDAVDPRRHESQGGFRISMPRAVVEYARRGQMDIAKGNYDLYVKLQGLRKADPHPASLEQVQLLLGHNVAYNPANTCEIPDAYNAARSAALAICDVLSQHNLYTPSDEHDQTSDIELVNDDGNKVLTISRTLSKAYSGSITRHPYTLDIAHDVYQFILHYKDERTGYIKHIAENLTVDARCGRVLHHHTCDWAARLASTIQWTTKSHPVVDLLAGKKLGG